MTSVMMKHIGGKYTLVVSGHADYNPGNDIVCAACSVLAETLNMALDQFNESYQSSIKSGFALIESSSKTAKPYFEMAYVGYKALAESYPDHVQIIKKE